MEKDQYFTGKTPSTCLNVPNTARVVEKGIQLPYPLDIVQRPKVDAPVRVDCSDYFVDLIVGYGNGVGVPRFRTTRV